MCRAVHRSTLSSNGSWIMVQNRCECCETVQLLESALEEILSDAKRGREVIESLTTALQLAKTMSVRCMDVGVSDPGRAQGLFWDPGLVRYFLSKKGPITR